MKVKDMNPEQYEAYRRSRDSFNEKRRGNRQVEVARRKVLRQDWEYAKAEKLRDRYQMTLEQFKALLVEQENSCPICLQAFTDDGKTKVGRWPCVDHDHKTEKNRGLLCMQCNTVLGHFLEDESYFIRALDYLEKYRE